MFTWYRQISSNERKTFWGCFAGWGLDAVIGSANKCIRGVPGMSFALVSPAFLEVARGQRAAQAGPDDSGAGATGNGENKHGKQSEHGKRPALGKAWAWHKHAPCPGLDTLWMTCG